MIGSANTRVMAAAIFLSLSLSHVLIAFESNHLYKTQDKEGKL